MEEHAFHLFSYLPLELREQIWLMAIRPDKPGVQTLRVYHPELDNPGHAEDLMGFAIDDDWRLRRSILPCLHRLALPLRNRYPNSIDGTTDHNISTYLIDGSLWTACQESRSVMKRIFGTNKPSSTDLAQSVTGYYFSGSAPLYITICFHTDLIILQFDDMANFNWYFLDDLFSNARDFSIGIEYNQKWAIEPYDADEDDGDDDLVSLAFHKLFELAEKSIFLDIWLIDHNLKRRKGVPSQKDSMKSGFFLPQVSTPFYANDRKFLKVNLEQGEDCLDYWQYLKPVYDGEYRKSSLYFADRFRQRVYDFAMGSYGHGHHFSCYSGLLGWDDL